MWLQVKNPLQCYTHVATGKKNPCSATHTWLQVKKPLQCYTHVATGKKTLAVLHTRGYS